MVKIRIAKLLHLLQAHAYVGIMKRERERSNKDSPHASNDPYAGYP